MPYESKPHLHALVAFWCAPFGLMDDPRVMPLEDAADYARFGWAVLVDPQDERDLAMWERLERASAPKRRWFDAR